MWQPKPGDACVIADVCRPAFHAGYIVEVDGDRVLVFVTSTNRLCGASRWLVFPDADTARKDKRLRDWLITSLVLPSTSPQQ